MARKALQPGEHTIDNSTTHDLGFAPNSKTHVWDMQWRANVSGETRKYHTRVTGSKADCRAAARKRSDELMEEARLSGADGWTPASKISLSPLSRDTHTISSQS